MPDWIRGFDAFFRRELAAGRASRSLLAAPAALLAVGLAPVFLAEVAAATRLYLLQGLLYLVPLFAIVFGASAAQADAAENGLLGSLPVSRLSRVAGKFCALLLLFGVAQVALYVPSAAAGIDLAELLGLWGYGFGASAAFLALGLLVGFRVEDGVKAHLLGLGIWLAVTFGFGFAAWGLAGTEWARAHPDLWLALLGASPLEALRIGVLFSVEAIPFSPDSIGALGKLWLERSGLWFAAVSLAWTAAALAFARPRRS